MNTFDAKQQSEREKFQQLVDRGLVSGEELETICTAAVCRNVPTAKILRFDRDIARRPILEALAAHYDCEWLEYDERLPVPPDILRGLDADRLYEENWVPVVKDGETVIIAAADPRDPQILATARECIAAERFEVRVALVEDIRGFIADFANSNPDHLIGNERTGLAYWRNTLARWRTRLACYRTDFAVAKTRLSLLRAGLTLIGAGNVLLGLKLAKWAAWVPLYWLMIIGGFGLVIYGVVGYFRLKHPIHGLPRHQTLVEVTAATMYFFEDFQFVDSRPHEVDSKKTMLARITDSIPNNSVYIDSSNDNKVRSALAHERNSLAAQRTLLACYRTIYSRARAGLSFIRTGVAFTSIGLGLIKYFGWNLLTIYDCFLLLAGLALIADGLVWYWPVRKEQHEASKCAMMYLEGAA